MVNHLVIGVLELGLFKKPQKVNTSMKVFLKMHSVYYLFKTDIRTFQIHSCRFPLFGLRLHSDSN